MNLSPVFLGTCLACALGGAIAGSSLGSTPVLARADTDTFAPADVPANYQSVAASEPNQPAPDHYPLVTPRGTVAIADLSDRGLYSQARYRANDAYVAVRLASDATDNDIMRQVTAPVTDIGAASVKVTPTPQQAHATSKPLKLATGPVQIGGTTSLPATANASFNENTGHVRLIHVSSTTNQSLNSQEPVSAPNR